MDDDEFEVTRPTRRMHLIDLGVIGSHLARDIATSFECAFDMLHSVLIGHANHLADQRRFHEQAAREIEALTSGDFPA